MEMMAEEAQPEMAYRRSASRAQRPDSSESGGWDGRASCGWNDVAAGTAGTEGCITGTSEGPEVESLR